MKHPLIFLLLALARITGLPAASVIAAEPVASVIAGVTVYADRAQVTREGAVALPAGSAHFALSQLPGWIDESSVRVSLTPADAGEIVDVELRRTYLARASDEDFREAQEAVREIADELAALADEQEVLEAQARHIEAIRVFSLEKLPQDVALREIQPSEYAETVDFIANSLREVAAARRQLEKKRRGLEPELDVRQRKLAELQQRSQLEQRTVLVTVRTATASQATMTVTYMLPGATWQPIHELRAATAAPSVALSSHAAVMQTSGEDWPGVELALATQRSTETLRIPEVEALLLGGSRSVTRWLASGRESFVEASKNWEMQNRAYYAARNPDSAVQETYRMNQMVQLDAAKQVDQVFAALQQRGTTAHFAARGRQTVRTDGRRVRVPIGSVQLEAGYGILAVPELSANAIRTVDLTNRGTQPLLPGKVSLYVDGSFLGLTEVDFIAPGEAFALYLGVADHIKLARSLDRKRSELSRRGARTKMSVSFLVRVENLSDHRETVQLRDRVAISETEEIRVSAVKITPDGAPDGKGILRWGLELGPGQAREYRIEYTIEYPTGLPSRGADLNRRFTDDQLSDEQLIEKSRRLEAELKALEENF